MRGEVGVSPPNGMIGSERGGGVTYHGVVSYVTFFLYFC